MAEPRIVAELLGDALRPSARLAAFEAALGDDVGAVASFTGLTRGSASDGSRIEGLFLDHHPLLTRQSLHEIAADGAGRFRLSAVEVVHRFGRVGAGEAIVWVAAAAAHRRAAFDAVDYLMDRLKTDAIFWKREDGADRSCWIEPTNADRTDRARWS